jgi:3-methyladenine DNA glycosylase/8-oxoguanine DNA glycosylase
MHDRENGVLEEVFKFLCSTPTPEQIIAFKPSDRSEDRLSELLSLNRQGTLAENDRVELDQYLWVNHLMNMLKIRVREKLTDVDGV